MRIEVHGAPIKRKDVPKPNLFPDLPPIQKVAATFQSEQVPKQTHMSQAVSQQHFAEGLETASMECKRIKSTKIDRPGGLHHAKNFEASGFCYVTRTTSKKTRAQQQATINKRGDALRFLKMPEPYLSTDVRQARRSGMSTSRLSQC